MEDFVPRRRPDKRSKPQSFRPERPGPAERRPPPGRVDEQALELREADASYSTIARQLGLRRATDAHKAFIRALRTRAGEDQVNLVAKEQVRLDRLEVRIRERDAAQPEKIVRRLEAVATLRAALP